MSDRTLNSCVGVQCNLSESVTKVNISHGCSNNGRCPPDKSLSSRRVLGKLIDRDLSSGSCYPCLEQLGPGSGILDAHHF